MLWCHTQSLCIYISSPPWQDNPKISKLDDWVQGHKEQVGHKQIGAALKEQFGGQLAKLGARTTCFFTAPPLPACIP